MTTITLSVSPELAQALPSDPAHLTKVLTLGLQQWQASELERLYTLHRPDEVRQFLLTVPDLVKALQAAYPHLQQQFGSEVEARLEVVHDPEVENWQTLFVYIQTSEPPEKALTCLTRFDEEWLSQQVSSIQDKLAFNLEFA